MSKSINIREITRNSVVIYYPEFFAAAPNLWNHTIIDKEWVETKIIEHLNNLKLIALYAHHIFIPYSHILASPIEGLLNVIERVFSNKDTIFMIDNEIIIIGGWAANNIQTSIEQEIEYIRSVHWCNIRTNSNLFCVTNNAAITFRDVRSQSDSLRLGVKDLLQLNYSIASPQYLTIYEMLARCEVSENIPFSHELFLRLIARSSLSSPLRDGLVREINRLYFKAGETGNAGVILYHVIGAEPDDISRTTYSTASRALVYHPRIFKLFLSIFLDDSELIQLYRLPGRKLFHIRQSEEWNNFVHSYHQLLRSLSIMSNVVQPFELTKDGAIHSYIINQLKSGYGKKYYKYLEIAVQILDLLNQLKAHSVRRIALSPILKVISEPLIGVIDEYIIRIRRPEIIAFIKQLKKHINT